MAREAVLGVETEYAFTHFGRNREARPRGPSLERMLHFARTQLASLRDVAAPGVYLGNGSRLYIDTGNHPEMSTPECSDPRELVRYIQAGERILAGLAAEVQKEVSGSRASIFRCNVDYCSGQTWGCHESYLHSAPQPVLAAEIIPHLVSRLIYTGTGGFDNSSPGISFMLSPRVSHLVKVTGDNSVRDRGIFHTKDEPLCKGNHHRLHLLCGESLCSELASFLKVGATALVVYLIEAGVCRGGEVSLESPVTAMRRFAGDPSCTRTAVLKNGRKASALEIQRHYLNAAEAHVSRSFMPAWAGEVCAAWRQMLDRLEEGPEAVSTQLDWGIKYWLYREHARKRGLEWDRLDYWSRLLESSRADPDPREAELEALARRRESRGERRPALFPQPKLSPGLVSKGASREEGRSFLALRAELFEIDTRFGELGSGGVFSAMNRAGVLDHSLPDLGSIDDAVESPPARGRAHERGEAIRSLCKSPARYAADWQSIIDRQEGRILDLSDPFGRGATWIPSPRSRTPDRDDLYRRVFREGRRR
jgi:proteasome accessory factor A